MQNRGATAQAIAAGSVLHAGRLISQVENGDPRAREVLRELAPRCGSAQIVGVTGPPGAGKSSLVAALIREIRDSGRTVGVVAVDPSSPFTGGALLGDRDRMLEASAGDGDVFIRSVAARGAQGGLAAAVNDAVDVLDAMGKDVVIVETVGVGQGELGIAKIAHTVVLVLVPGYGDTLQAMKAGILEIADIVAVNKGDTPGADQTRKELAQQRYERRDPSGGKPWKVPVVLTSALRREGVAELLAQVDRHYDFQGSSAWKQLTEQRRRQARFVGFVESLVRQHLLTAAEEAVEQERLTDPFGAAQEYVMRLLEAHTQITTGPLRAAAGTESR